MKKHRSRIILLCLLMSVSLLASCGTSTPAATSAAATSASAEATTAEVAATEAATEATPAASELEPLTIKFMNLDFVNAPTNMDQMTYKALGEKFNFKYEFNLVNSADYGEKLNVTLASGDLPDFFNGSVAALAKYYSSGAVRKLNDLLAQYAPNVLAEIDSHQLTKNVKDDNGDMYFIPAVDESAALECNIFVNGEWMDELGITKMPVTTDEYYTLLKTFKEKKGADSVPLVGGPWYDIKANIFRSFKTINGWVMFKPEEGYVYAPYQLADNTKLALSYMNKLYSEGLMDKEYLDRDTESQLALISSNKAGSFNSWADGASLWCKGGKDGRDFRMIPPLQGSNGERWTGTKGAIGGSYFISSACSDEVAQRILLAANYVFSPEGKTLFDFGIEGDTYTLVDGKPVFTDKVLKHEAGALNGRRTFGMGLVAYPMVLTWQGWAGVLWQQTVDVVDASLPFNMPQQPNLTGTEAEEGELATIMTDIDKYVNTSIDEFILGRKDIEKDWPTFIAQLETMNIKRAIEIQNVKFDRWKSR